METISLTDAIMISFPAPEDPPMSATIKLGIIAKLRVKMFLIHGVSFKSRNPYKYECVKKGAKFKKTLSRGYLKSRIMMYPQVAGL